ncbi:hypothetical protein TSUD_398360 [Trifolium subterraneum]|uniref:Reverse transcriptase zinc-binding domain-containing protein n=1 Tax=Trifolium subterraneum TaxID=3900 RepID=A0A2Z6NI78_TRISU|nr:hypothetical protein TSUD_398360 [Trifolium subterraneum]
MLKINPTRMEGNKSFFRRESHTCKVCHPSHSNLFYDDYSYSKEHSDGHTTLTEKFYLGHDEGQKKMHMIKWDTMLLPEESGGLAVRNLPTMNQACLMKMGWNLREGNIIAYGLVQSWNNLNKFEEWSIGSGRSVQAWRDKWLEGGIVLAQYMEHIPTEIDRWKVADLVDSEGNWKTQILSPLLPPEISKIIALPPPMDVDGADEHSWPGDHMGSFTISSAYKLVCGYHELEMDAIWKRIWRLEVPERIRCFIWSLRYGRIPTNKVIWATTSYHLWLWRNKEKFDYEFASPCPSRRYIHNCVENYYKAQHSTVVIMEHPHITINVRWEAQLASWHNVNTNGAVQNSIVECGGVLRDHQGA